MDRLHPRLVDLLLVLVGVVAVGLAIYSVQRQSAGTSSELSSAPTTILVPGSPIDDPSPTPSPSATVAAPERRVVLLGQDLSDPLLVAAVTNRLEVPATAPQAGSATPLSPELSADLAMPPALLVMEITTGVDAGRDAFAALSVIRRRAPGTRVVLLGPLRKDDVGGPMLQQLADRYRLSYLDPVAEKWLRSTVHTVLTPAQRDQVGLRLADDLQRLLA